MPLQRRLPKRGFTNPFRKEFEVVNLQSLGQFAAGSVVDPAALAEAGLAGKRGGRIKVLGKGTIEHALTVKAHGFSEAAKAAIEAKGGSVEVLA
jgi:large subunit ribosomal protein L15